MDSFSEIMKMIDGLCIKVPHEAIEKFNDDSTVIFEGELHHVYSLSEEGYSLLSDTNFEKVQEKFPTEGEDA